MRYSLTVAVIALVALFVAEGKAEQKVRSENMWPEVKAETRPWTRWWWLGSAVDKETLTRLLEEYQRAGLGGVEITCIYGVKGVEARNTRYLSPQWRELVRHTVVEANRLGMQVDLPPGSGWKMGGDFLEDSLAATKIRFEGNKVSIKPSGEKIKRPGPGGAGKAFNPFNRASLQAVTNHFTPALEGLGIRAQFHDSWEYDSNGRPDLVEVFKERCGYDLREHVADGGIPERVLYDLQYLLAELALEEFVQPWSEWCHELGQLSRNQAHGSPGNLLDLYAACDIPETEVFRHIKPDTPLLSKFASSAAHVAGRRLVSSETGTWIGEHFQVSLALMKRLCDNLFVSGINHHVYHGTAYSPKDAPWPGWLFYASSQLNPQNTVWRDFATLNKYVERCQSVLQDGEPANDLLVYFPVHDVLHDRKRKLAGKLAIEGDWLFKLPAIDTLRELWLHGYSFDYVSDRQITGLSVVSGQLAAPGGSYKVLLVPPCYYMPAETLEQLVQLSEQGAKIVFAAPGPSDVPGLADLDMKRARFRNSKEAVVPADDLRAALSAGGVERENLTDHDGLRYIRRAHEQGLYYFIVNESDRAVDDWIELRVGGGKAAIMDPMTGLTGRAAVRDGRVRLQLDPGATLIVKTGVTCAETWPYCETSGISHDLKGNWQIRFVAGGPEFPDPYQTDELSSWSARGGVYESFAGTAEYTITFDAPEAGGRWLLDLGEVHASARVRLNGKDVSTLIGPSYRVVLDGVLPKGNKLTVEVTSLAANRIRDLDRRRIQWRIFQDINFVNRDYKPFDASKWPVMPAGLEGPVRLQRIVPASRLP